MNLSNFTLDGGVYCQKNFNTGEFEQEYFSIRGKEGRILDDDTVKQLPFIDHPEWKIRARSAKKLVKQLKKENCRSFIEIGCGNGWLTNYIQRELNIPAIGIDVGRVELKQAARISNGKATFVYGDVFSLDLNADATILAACIQYFPDPCKVIERLNGIIHIIDSPFYQANEIAAARQRSKDYFKSKGANMDRFYFHHEFIKGAEVLYRPNRFKTFLGGSPFPWLRIRKGL
ncbi:MAG TPA: methyltransferase domain-containing protein [Cyclobacteriaceae bacterium]